MSRYHRQGFRAIHGRLNWFAGNPQWFRCSQDEATHSWLPFDALQPRSESSRIQTLYCCIPGNFAGCTMLLTPATPTWRFSRHRCGAIALCCCWVQLPDEISGEPDGRQVTRPSLCSPKKRCTSQISKVTFRRLKFPTMCVCVCARVFVYVRVGGVWRVWEDGWVLSFPTPSMRVCVCACAFACAHVLVCANFWFHPPNASSTTVEHAQNDLKGRMA